MSMILVSRAIDKLAAEVAALTGETVPEAIQTALTERLTREKQRRSQQDDLLVKIREIAEHFAALPDIDPRNPDEIIGYDENGMW